MNSAPLPTRQPRSLRALLMLCLATLLANLAPLTAHAATAPAPGKVFKDCKNCPEMVVLPAGSYLMGTPEDEIGREGDEGPQHTVTFAKPFAMSRFHVTAAELDAYIRETGVVIKDGDTRPGRLCKASKPSYKQGPRQPAVCIDYFEVQAYTEWLSKKPDRSTAWSASPNVSMPLAPAAPDHSPSRSMTRANTRSANMPTPTAPRMAIPIAHR